MIIGIFIFYSNRSRHITNISKPILYNKRLDPFFLLPLYLFDAIETYGKPKIIRTDNEAVFTSRLFRFALSWLGIKHQKIDKGCPWQNGRVERFFGTVKEKLNQWDVSSLEQLGGALTQLSFWYNHVRPHQHLKGQTPAEVWQGKDIYINKKPKKNILLLHGMAC